MIVFSNVSKRYPTGFEALRNLNFEIAAGDFVFLTGHSGAGKTTLFRLIAAIEKPSTGSIVVGGQNLTALRKSATPYLRRGFGLIFQDHKLLHDRSVLENVAIALDILGLPRKEGLRRARAALDKVGLLEREKALPIALSGGEQQKLAIARAVAGRPTVILADEPTANLDQDSAREVMELFSTFNQVGTTVIIATHDAEWIPVMQPRVLMLQRGELVT